MKVGESDSERERERDCEGVCVVTFRFFRFLCEVSVAVASSTQLGVTAADVPAFTPGVSSSSSTSYVGSPSGASPLAPVTPPAAAPLPVPSVSSPTWTCAAVSDSFGYCKGSVAGNPGKTKKRKYVNDLKERLPSTVDLR